MMEVKSKVFKSINDIEVVIVLIAFVFTATALAFVALNMGFYIAQRGKEVTVTSLAQVISFLEVDGSVLAKMDTDSQRLNCMVIPIRLSAEQKPVDLTPCKTQIALWVIGKEAFTNLYTEPSQAYAEGQDSFDITSVCSKAESEKGVAVVWGPGSNGDMVLDVGEKVLVVISFRKLPKPIDVTSYDVVKVEIKPPIGVALTVERTVPTSLTNSIIDLG